MTNEPQKTPSPDTKQPVQNPQQTQGDPKSGNEKSGGQQK
jgi:hypothetical protein